MGSNDAVKSIAVAMLLILAIGMAEGMRQSFAIKPNAPSSTFLDKFVFMPGGTLKISMSMDRDYITDQRANVGVFAVISKSGEPSFTFPDQRCPLDPLVVSTLNSNHTTMQFRSFELFYPRLGASIEINRALQGLWSLHFIICGSVSSDFHGIVNLTMDNVDMSGKQSYLSAGEIPLPYTTVVAGTVYLALLGIWIKMLTSPSRTRTTIHWMMLLLIIFKTMATFSESFMYFTMATKGESKGWNIAFYVFQSLRAFFLFFIILMIGSGWQLIKAYLTDSDRFTFWIVIPLQVAANIGVNVCDELGIRNLWFYFFHLLDVICCILVLLPIIRNIESLQGKADTDNKFHRMLANLERLSRFYLLVVGYIYVTRVLGAVLTAFLPVTITWVSSFIVELCTIGFYILSGYEFRPARDNSLFHSLDDTKDHEKGSD